jgi:hypothetical protein
MISPVKGIAAKLSRREENATRLKELASNGKTPN